MLVSRISVRLLVSTVLLDFAKDHFRKLLEDFHEDVLQELRMVDAFLLGASDDKKCRMARRALSWLSYNVGQTSPRPRCHEPQYEALPALEEGTFLKDLSDQVEVARVYERAA